MGEIEIDLQNEQLIIYSNIITYGNAATAEITEQIRDEIETMWNEPKGHLRYEGLQLTVIFRIEARLQKDIDPFEIYQNYNPRNNYFRIEEFAHGNISFVDGLKCNTGYFKLENLYKGSTTAAHEYGHTLGLDHPHHIDIRGMGVPGIMYPRGTLVEPQFQYDPTKQAGETGGTMHPKYRKVLDSDIADLKLNRLSFHGGRAILGEFSSVYHPDHSDISHEDFMRPPIFG